MHKGFIFFALFALPVWGQEYKIAVVGLVHSHVWGHLDKMVKGQPAKLVGIAETIPELVAEAKRRGVPEPLFYSDYRKMLDETKPDIVWAFVENNRHLEIAQACAPRGIHVLFEKPLAPSYKDAVAIRDLAAKHKIRVMSNYQMAWWPSQYAAKAQADSGALGKVWRLHGIVGHGGPGNSEGLNKYFFDWLTDPVKNGAGALVDFGCYNALWSLWYLGMPDTVYATDEPASARALPEGGRQRRDRAPLPDWSRGVRGKLGPAAEFPGPRGLRTRRQRLHDRAQNGSEEEERRAGEGGGAGTRRRTRPSRLRP